jgi:hypothetical protein
MKPIVAPNCPNCLMRCELDDIGYFWGECVISLPFWEFEF